MKLVLKKDAENKHQMKFFFLGGGGWGGWETNEQLVDGDENAAQVCFLRERGSLNLRHQYWKR